MSSTVFLSLGSFFYIVLISIVYFVKPKIRNLENQVYKGLIAVSLLSLISELSLVVIPHDISFGIYDFMLKFYLACCFSWVTIFMLYIYIVAKKKQKETDIVVKKIIPYIIIYLFCLTCIFLLPIYFRDDPNIKYSYGPSVNFVFSIVGISLFITIVFLLFKHKNLKEKYFSKMHKGQRFIILTDEALDTLKTNQEWFKKDINVYARSAIYYTLSAKILNDIIEFSKQDLKSMQHLQPSEMFDIYVFEKE